MKGPMRTSSFVLTLVAAALFPAGASNAQDPGVTSPAPASTPAAAPDPGSWRGLYVGGGGAYSNVSVEVGQSYCDYDCYWGDYYDYDQGDGGIGYNAHAGARLHRYVAVEVNYLRAGTIGWDKNLVYMPEFNDYYNNRVDLDMQVTGVSVLGIVPFNDLFEIYLRFGAGFWDGESTQRLDQSFGEATVTRSVSDDGTGLLLGVGFGLNLSRSLQLRFDLQTVGIDEDVLNAQEDTSLDSFLFEVQYRFGAN